MAHIIVVDDDPGIRSFLERYLSGLGHEVRAVATGRAGLELVDAWSPDVLITDINMPDMDGIELIRAARSRSAVAMIAISGGGLIPTEVLLGNAHLLGAVATIAKPFEPAAMRSLIESVLADAQAEREGR